MEEKRDILELLILLRCRIGELFILNSGLCHECLHMNIEGIISLQEKTMLDTFIDTNRPHDYNHEIYGYSFAWERRLLQPRIEFLDAHIKQLITIKE